MYLECGDESSQQHASLYHADVQLLSTYQPEPACRRAIRVAHVVDTKIRFMDPDRPAKSLSFLEPLGLMASITLLLRLLHKKVEVCSQGLVLPVCGRVL